MPIPIAADQPDNARHCAELGLGRVVPLAEATPAATRDAARAVLGDLRYRGSTLRLRDEMAALPGVEHGVRLVEDLVGRQGPRAISPRARWFARVPASGTLIVGGREAAFAPRERRERRFTRAGAPVGLAPSDHRYRVGALSIHQRDWFRANKGCTMPSSTPPPYPGIRVLLEQGRVVPFLGSGASIVSSTADVGRGEAGGPPLPSAIELSRRLSTLSGLGPASACDVSLMQAAQYVEISLGPDFLHDRLRDIFEPTRAWGGLHDFFATCDGIRLIVTTNYDTLIEQAFRHHERPYHVIVHETRQERVQLWRHGEDKPSVSHCNEVDLDLDSDRTPVIYKIHGSVSRGDPELDSFVITEDHYHEFLARMVTNEAIPKGLVHVLQASHFLFLGYGLGDWNLRVLLHSIWKQRASKLPSWAIQLDVLELERKLWEHRDVAIYDMRLDAFVEGLERGG